VLLANGKKLKAKQDASGVTLILPVEAPDKLTSVICLEITDQTPRIAVKK
jgi:hypothetical protein